MPELLDPSGARREVVVEWFNGHAGHFYAVARRLAKSRTRFQDAELLETPFLGRVLSLDGMTQAAESGEFEYHEALAHPALLAHPDPRARSTALRSLTLFPDPGQVFLEPAKLSLLSADPAEVRQAAVLVTRLYDAPVLAALKEPVPPSGFKDMMGMGDMLNDLQLVQMAGVGVAMPHGQEPVKQAADFVPDSSTEGVAEAIEKYVLQV